MNFEKISKSFDEFLDGKIAKLPKVQKIAFGSIIIVLPLVLFYLLVYSPNTEKIQKLQHNETALKTELASLKHQAENLAKFEQEKKLAEEQFAAISILLPDKKEIPSLLTNISGLGTSSGLDFLSFKPGGERPKEFYAEIPVSIQVHGQYHNVGHFLDQISKLHRIVTVSNIKMGSPSRQKDEMLLNTSFNLVTYRFIEPAAKDGKKNGKKKRK
ncbi:MAG: type 4a pilus biogenesis protein PilO [Deltaproteobacteria bacterium]